MRRFLEKFSPVLKTELKRRYPRSLKMAEAPAPHPWVANCQGFSLLEVMVATTIMGLVLVVLLQVLTGAMTAQETSLGHAQALEAADRVLQDGCNAMDLSSRQYTGQDGPYSYLVKVTPQYEVTTPSTLGRVVRCALIQVTVTWEERGRKRSVSLETIRAASQKGL